MSDQPGPARPPGPRTPLIIVGFDMSLSSQHALAYSAGVAARMRARLAVVYVTTYAPVGGLAPFETATLEAARVDQIMAARDMATEILSDLPADSWQFMVKPGEAAAALERLAIEQDADVIVTGRSRLPARHILGSVPARLVRHATCPITVVP